MELDILSMDNQVIGSALLSDRDGLLSFVFETPVISNLLPRDEDTDFSLLDCMTETDRFFLKAVF